VKTGDAKVQSKLVNMRHVSVEHYTVHQTNAFFSESL